MKYKVLGKNPFPNEGVSIAGGSQITIQTINEQLANSHSREERPEDSDGTYSEDAAIAMNVEIDGVRMIFVPDNDAELQRLFQSFSDSDFQRRNGVKGKVNITFADHYDESFGMAQDEHELALSPGHVAIDMSHIDEHDGEQPAASYVVDMPQDSEVSCMRKMLRAGASLMGAVPEAGLLSIGLANFIKQTLNGHVSADAAWGVFAAVIAVGTGVGTWYKHNYYGRNFTEESVDQMTDGQVRSMWAYQGGNILCALWGAYEGADGYLAGTSLVHNATEGMIGGIVLAAAKFAKTMAVERPRVMDEQHMQMSQGYTNTLANMGRKIKELAPVLLNAMHTKAVVDLATYFVPGVGFAGKAALYLISSATIGQAAAYVTSHFDSIEGDKNLGVKNHAEWGPAHASSPRYPTHGSKATYLADAVQTGQALPQMIRSVIAKCGGSKEKQDQFVNGVMTCFQTLGLGALFSSSVIKFFEENLPALFQEHRTYIEVGAALGMTFSAFFITRGKMPTAMANEKTLDVAENPNLIYETLMRELCKCGCVSREEQRAFEAEGEQAHLLHGDQVNPLSTFGAVSCQKTAERGETPAPKAHTIVEMPSNT